MSFLFVNSIMKFNELYNILTDMSDSDIIEESVLSYLQNPRSLIAMALLLGVTHYNYTIPKLREIVTQKAKETPPQTLQAIQQEVPKKMATPLVDALIKQISKIEFPKAATKQETPLTDKFIQDLSTIKYPEKIKTDDFISDAFKYIKKHEGVYNTMYKDIYGNLTIGIGHLVKPEEVEKFEGKTLTDSEIEDIFRVDIKNKLALIQRHFGADFNKFSKNMKIAILDGYFRGDLSGSPKARLLLKSRKFPEAAKEYLANKEYEKAKKAKSGVASRMENNARIFASGG
jgi:GH24 family phage-related lysozyme (muramidase)